ncbi:MAG: MFS transporter [Tumebacillaceae bacterium]
MKWVNRNIAALYVNAFLGQLYFDRALWVLYLGERGMNMAQVGVLEGLLHLFIVLFEIPTGVIADLYGRKKSLLIGSFISLGYALFMMIGGHFFVFSLAFALFGLANTFKSGAGQALFYDTLAAAGQESRYTKIMGNEAALIYIALSVAQWGGGVLAEHSWNWVYGGILVIQVIAIVPLLLVKEPQHEEVAEKASEAEPQRGMLAAWKGQFSDSYEVWKNEKSVRMPIVMYIMVNTSIVIVVFYAQAFLAQQGFSKSQIGLIFTIDYLLGAAAAKFVHHLERKWAFGKLIQGFYYLIALLLVVFATLHGYAGVVAMWMMGSLASGLDPVFSNFVQGKLTSKIRATFFSMISVVVSLSIVVAFPLFGAVVDWLGFETSYLWLMGAMAVVGVYASWKG